MSTDSLARIAAANSAAFLAPATPMAKAATGMPLGIWAIDSSESMPFRALDWTGTPSRGTDVLAAFVPAKCAAPPAPAMMAFRPRSRAVAAYSNSRSGVRWADTTRTSCAMPRESSTPAAACIVSQSDDDPMMIPTRAFICGSLPKRLPEQLAQKREKLPCADGRALLPALFLRLFQQFGQRGPVRLRIFLEKLIQA